MAGKKPQQKPQDPTVSFNRKALHDYEILKRLEAGLALTGTEIKSIREGRANIREAYARPENGELFLHNAHIAQYGAGSYLNHQPTRSRKLLLHKKEIRDLEQSLATKGLTLVPLRLYLKRGRAKLELGLAKGKREYDKRHAIREREVNREIGRALRDKA
jgi:SsrA-binding protein